ncbi:RNA polymerase sigma factor [Chitinophaga lutea]
MSVNQSTTSGGAPAWEGLQRGDRAAFARLYQEHIHGLIAYGMRLSTDENIVRDTIQDLFLDVWRNRERLPPVRSERAYLLGALRFKLLRHTRVRTRYFAEVPEHGQDAGVESAFLQGEETIQQAERVRRAIARLSPRQQEMVNLRFFQSCTTEEAAQIMDVNYQSAANLLHRAIALLRQHLDVLLIAILIFF